MTELTNELILIQSSRKRRAAAFIIDHFVLSFLAIAILILSMGPDFIDTTDNALIKKEIIFIMIPIIIIYFCKDLINGISLGRWIMGIMVRDENNPNEVPSKGRLVMRNLFLLIWPVEFIVLAISNNKHRLGDNVAKTVVLKNPNKAKKSYRIITLVVIGIAFIAFTIFFTSEALKTSEAYKTAIQNIESNADILNETGGIKRYGSFPTGNINVSNGFGQAEFKITVIGNSKEIEVNIFLEKEPNDVWKVTELQK